MQAPVAVTFRSVNAFNRRILSVTSLLARTLPRSDRSFTVASGREIDVTSGSPRRDVEGNNNLLCVLEWMTSATVSGA